MIALAVLTVAAASDLSHLEPQLRDLAQRGGVAVRFVFGSSGQLAQQIRQGAPYDVFLSANERYARDLEKEGVLSPGTLKEYARGRVALWSPAGKLKSLDELAAPAVRHVAIANPVHAPYGAAAKQILERRNLWAALSGRIVFAENVRQAAQFAESGNADAGLVAWALVKERGAVPIDASLHDPIVQVGGVVAKSAIAADGARFLAILTGDSGKALLAQAGYDAAIAAQPAAAEPAPTKPRVKKRTKKRK
ncbi:MAG: molybdate ABC transporter substrate-binding protein [Bryobacteraceae bacterium]